MVTAPMPMQCFIRVKVTLLSNYRSIMCQVVAYGKLKLKESFKLLALKLVAVANERWLLTRSSRYSDFTW